jgi:probable rRNA maturation factor
VSEDDPSRRSDPGAVNRPTELALRNPNRYPEVRLSQLRPWLSRVVEEVAPGGGSLGVLFTSDRRMRRLNHTYRDRDCPTDVLSFPGEETVEGVHLGDIVISVPTARRQAARCGLPVERELEILLIHGLLHCVGYDHETDGGTMERLESRLRSRWVGDGDG